ncbi:MAG: hypothetical protein U9Q99_01695 [Nanoarchaeota archaeon]|nr:hypothetical protein [Nanoarchaeota archaeon]
MKGSKIIMEKGLAKVLKELGNHYKNEIQPDSESYSLADIGQAAECFGEPQLKEKYADVRAVIPQREQPSGLTFQIDPSGFSEYVQLDSGIAVESSVAKAAGLECKKYIPQESMYLTFVDSK